MSITAAAEAMYRLKDRLRLVTHLLPQPLRKRLFSLVTAAAIARLPSRRYLRSHLLPALAEVGCRRLLFVGAQSYNRSFFKDSEARGVAVWSVDSTPAAALWGSPRGHFV